MKNVIATNTILGKAHSHQFWEGRVDGAVKGRLSHRNTTHQAAV